MKILVSATNLELELPTSADANFKNYSNIGTKTLMTMETGIITSGTIGPHLSIRPIITVSETGVPKRDTLMVGPNKDTGIGSLRALLSWIDLGWEEITKNPSDTMPTIGVGEIGLGINTPLKTTVLLEVVAIHAQNPAISHVVRAAPTNTDFKCKFILIIY